MIAFIIYSQNFALFYRIQITMKPCRPISNNAIRINKYPTIKEMEQSESLSQTYEMMSHTSNPKTKANIMINIILRCYNNIPNQVEICSKLQLPFVSGPISLNSLPKPLLFKNQEIKRKLDQQENIDKPEENSNNQLQFIFNFLKNVREYYYCWIIYFNQQINVISLKLFKKEEISEHPELFDFSKSLIGIFIGKQKEKHQNLLIKRSKSQKINLTKKQFSHQQLDSKLIKIHAESQYINSNATTANSLKNGVKAETNLDKKRQIKKTLSIINHRERKNHSKLQIFTKKQQKQIVFQKLIKIKSCEKEVKYNEMKKKYLRKKHLNDK